MNIVTKAEEGPNADSLQRYIKAMELNTQWLLQRKEQREVQAAGEEKPQEEWEDDVSIQPAYMSVPDIGRQEETRAAEVYQKAEESTEERLAKRRMAVAGYINFGESMKAQSDAMEHGPHSLNKKG